MLSLNDIIDWKDSSVPDPKVEQVVGVDNFQDPWFLRKGLELSKAIGVIPGHKGTGFLIANSLIMTNWHVLRQPDWAAGDSIVFDFEQNEDGLSTTPDKIILDPDTFFYSNEALDVAVVAVQGTPGLTRGKVNLRSLGTVFEDCRVNIIQHPGAGFKKIAIRDNGIKFFDDNIIQYWTDTEKGSSGSPLFDDKWDIIGLHYRADNAPAPGVGKIYFNEGHRITAIIKALEDDKPEIKTML
jgi:hypothetical protein